MKRFLQIGFSLVLVLAACACSKVKTEAAEPIVAKTVKQSHVQIGGAIAVTSKILTDVMVGREVVVEITFTVKPHEELVVEVTPNNAYQLEGNPIRITHSNEQGVAILHIHLTPLVAGKQYLKMMALADHGTIGSPVVVALPVAAEDGEVPEKPKEVKDRVEFESLPVK